MLRKNAVNFAVVSHIYCKTYSFDVFAVVLWGSHRKSGAVSAGFYRKYCCFGRVIERSACGSWVPTRSGFCQMHCGSARYSGILRGGVPQSSRFCAILSLFACKSECARRGVVV